ncbi:MAG: ATP-binding cassette domain-containing protein [Saprospiraceae bacterium]
MITIKNLSKKFGSKSVLNGIDLSFEKGKVYGVVGKNGAGKTTLFNCIAGVERYTGDIDSEYDVLKNHIGILETNPVFLSRITGWEYLKLHCIARGIGTDNFEDQNIFELPLGAYAATYSTGMKKKLALMAILLQKNDVYILDEPFNGVDIQSNILISAIIDELKIKGKTVIISSHIFSTLSDTCDAIFLMKDGLISKTATKEQYAELEDEMKTDIVGDGISRLVL